jgi:hypothetical protein
MISFDRSACALSLGQDYAFPLNVDAPLVRSHYFGNVTTKFNSDNHQAIRNDRRWGWGVQRQGIKYKVEDPIGYLPRPRPLAFQAGELDHTLGKPDIFRTGWSIDIPSAVITAPTSRDKGM